MSGTARLRTIIVVVALSMLTIGATAQSDGGREEEGRYVATPGDGEGGLAGPLALGAGRVDFEVRSGETRALITIADAVADRTEAHAVFRFGDAPIRHVVTFCRQHGLDIPDGATDLSVVVEPLVATTPQDSTCGEGHGATTGTVTARFG